MRISVKVIPNAKKNEVAEDYVDLLENKRILKVRVNQPPEDGRANQALIEVLASYFGVKKNAIEIISGATSRNKILEVKNI